MSTTSSLFSQLLQHFPRIEFERLVIKHGAEVNAKGFHCWTQFVSMLFCHLAHADSLREICNGLKCCLGKLRHLGITKPPNKSTLSYANEHRIAALFEDVFYTALSRFRHEGTLGTRKKKFRFRNKLFSLDSSTISLCLKLFLWADFRRTKGGVKVHVLLDHDHYMPSYVHITTAKKHDVKAARLLTLNPGSIVAMDRAYNDFTLFHTWTQQGISFVTRMKENTSYMVIESQAVPRNRNILSDEFIVLTGVDAVQKCPDLLRRI
ncbi:IS4 family transposase, partial [bacterium]|nr:IS4 family transposase [bacterium]